MSRRASYPADLYLALHRGTPGDVAFYQRHCRGAASILELGCGDGRLLHRLARPGRTLHGIDQQLSFLALARERQELQGKGVRLWQGDMACFESARRFDRTLLPFSGFFCLSPRKKHECLRTVRRHLKPDGLLLLDVYNTAHLRSAQDLGASEPILNNFDWVGRVFVAAQAHDVYERHAWYPSRQRIDVTYRYCAAAKSAAGKKQRAKPAVPSGTDGTIRHWYLHREQLLALIEHHGFSVRAVSLNGPLANAEQWAVIAKRRD